MKVFHLSVKENTKHHLIPFHYERDNFEIVDSPHEADIISTILHTYESSDFSIQLEKLKELNLQKNQYLAVTNIWHAGDYEWYPDKTVQLLRDAGFNAFHVHSNHLIKDDPLQIYYDHMWNRQKAYFIDYDKFDLSERLWSFKATKKMYELEEIKTKTLVKKFLVPNKTYTGTSSSESDTPRSRYRVRLRKTILEQDCYFSDPENYIFLESEELSDEVVNDYHYYTAGMGFHPLANHYYQTSAISVYVESLVIAHNWKQLTEKTLNPFIKGHFILPFSYAGFIKDLKNIYGFKFPDWIDYNYDNFQNDEDRYREFMKSFTKLRFKKLEELEMLCNKDIDILHHNKQIFFDRPYCSLYEELQKSINTGK